MEDYNHKTFPTLFRGKGILLEVKNVKQLLKKFDNSGCDYVYFSSCGKKLLPELMSDVSDDREIVVRSHVRVLGGKGGFGSMLRAIGAQIEKTTNREACRDLSGRRMRDVNNEKAINEWLDKQKAEEEDRARKKKEKLEKILNPPRHILNDSSYVSEIRATADKVDDALKQGLQTKSKTSQDTMSATTRKRHSATKLATDKKQKTKKQKMWLDFDSDESVEDAESSSSDEGLSQIASPVEIEVREGVQSSSVENRIAHSGANENLATTEPDAVEIEDSKESAEKSNERNVKNEDELSGKQETVKHDEKAILQSSVAKEDTSVEDINLMSACRAEDLEVYGLERLKAELMKHGLKCGGTLKQRAERLYLLKDTPVDSLDRSLFAKAKKKQAKS